MGTGPRRRLTGWQVPRIIGQGLWGALAGKVIVEILGAIGGPFDHQPGHGVAIALGVVAGLLVLVGHLVDLFETPADPTPEKATDQPTNGEPSEGAS